LLERPTGDSERTEYADTIDPAQLEAARIDAARTRHQLAPVAALAAAAKPGAAQPDPPSASPAVSQSWWALIPGGLALAAALIIFAFVVLRAPEAPEPPQPDSTAQGGAAAPEPPSQPSAAEAPANTPQPTASKDPAPPNRSAQPALTPAPSKPAPTSASAARSSPVASKAGPPVGSVVGSAAPDKSQTRTEEPPSKATLPTIIPNAAKPSLAPKTPSAPPAADARLLVTLAKVQVQGAMSRQRCQDALTRHLPKAGQCLEPLVPASRMRIAGEVIATADVDAKGRLRNLKSQGLTGATPCLINAFASARLPEDDMGMAKVRFTLRYRTVSP